MNCVRICVAALLLGGFGCGGPSSMNNSALQAPSSLAGTAMGTGYHLTWKDNSETEEEFVVERKTGSGSFEELARVPFNTTQYMVENSEAGKMYTFRVMAVAGAEKSGMSNEVMWMP